MIAIIALLMAILMPALGRVKKQAKAVICQSNLKQWGICFAMYALDNDGRFMKGWMDDTATWGAGKQWMNQLRPCYRNQGDIRLCPMTKRPTESWRLGGTFRAWARFEVGDDALMEGDYGSYGMNDWAYNPPGANEDELYLPESKRMGQSKGSFYWRGPDVRNPHNIPLFFDCIWTDAWPDHTNPPPELPAVMTDTSSEQMRRICMTRHDDGVNHLFLDYSVRKVALKELWTLKWNPHFDTDGPSTIAGGMMPEEWPPWLRKFKDY